MTENQPLRFAQLSDLHLREDTAYLYRDKYNAFENFRKVLTEIEKEKPNLDFLLITGDIADAKEPEVYVMVDKLLRKTALPYYWLPGNHDNPELMDELVPRLSVAPDKSFTGKGIHFILLDSVAKNRKDDFGELWEADLQFLEKELKKNKSRPCVIALHHHLIPTGTAGLDRYILHEVQHFWDITDKYAQVCAVLYGHIHQITENMRKNVQYLSCPSTAYQFKKTPDIQFEDMPGGYRIIEIDKIGQIKTKLSYCP
jgi:Icc protein